jgi:tRNA pseudouridine38-40 synthase
MWKYVALISYEGTSYCGWQKQKGDHPSIQQTIQECLHRMTGEQPSVVGSGRTDSGVHALGQVAHFVLQKKEWDVGILYRGLNGLLPSSIQVQFVKKVPLDFHAQRSAEKKQYSYYFQQGPCALPHMEPLSWWIRKTLDQKAMQESLDILKGEHDFKPFQASGAKPGPTVRKILDAEISWEPLAFPALRGKENGTLGLVRVRLVGTGFLKQMVRGIAGTLLQVGEGRRSPLCFREILDTGNRLAVGPTAPARALWLERVWYPEAFGLDGLKP